ncbi:hypothetical protein SNE40_005492 [Patella caerulea]|uniref:FAM234A/B beta-propeller domain-containing protein n=1 Tax=Patella caerulea TaxID=87958 RepID=A0AAN8JX36_PATCE
MKLRKGYAYKQLNLSEYLSDNEDSDDDDLHGSDDDVIFDRGSKGRLLVKGSEKLGDHVKLKIMGKRPRKQKYKKSNKGVCKNLSCKMCVILGLSILFIGSALTIPVLHWHKIGGGGTVNNFKDWSLVYDDAASESVLRLLDIDDDGKDDLLIGIIKMASNESNSSPHTLAEFDDFKGILIAVRGYDGKELWRTEEFGSSILFMNCHDIDVNKDGRKDCIVTGRKATIVAIDVKDGKILWTSKSEKHYQATWNIYHVSVLPDFTSDGIPELLVTHGGDPKADPENHERESGRLILISGMDGKPLGNFYSLPKFKETYMTSVIYTRPLGDQYILYGTGGETVPGSLLAISVPDFYRNVRGLPPDAPVPTVNVSLYTPSPKPMKKGVMTLISGTEKGVMVPPIIVDINNDSVPDILVSLFEGKLVLLDGKTLDKVWSTAFPNSEFYSTPAPGYFDEDNYLDFMFHVSQGAWMKYNYTRHVVISGKDGSILWEMVSNGYDMSSDLVVKTTQHCDLFIFRMIGRKKSDYVIDVKYGRRVHHLDNRTKNIDQKQNSNENINEATPHISEASPNISEATSHISEATANISEARANISEATANISEATANISEATLQISEATPNISEATPNISEARANISEASANISEATPHISEATANISEATLHISEATPNISEATPNISEATPNISEATPNISEARANFSEARANISDARANISEARANISEARANISEARANISVARANISETSPNISEATPNLKIRQKRHEIIEVTNELYNLTAAQCLERKKDYEKDHIICGPDSVKLDQEIFIVGRATNYQPIKVLEAKAMEYKYDVENKQCGTVGKHRTFCVLSTPDIRQTGAVGNLDGGSNLQLVTPTVYSAIMVDDAYEYRKGKQKFITKLQRVDLRRILETGIKIKSPIFKKIKPKHKLASDVHFLPKDRQRWLEYLGSNNYNVY